MSDIWTPGEVDTVKGFDAARCPDPVPKGYDWCMVYAGGSSASHAWSDAELARVAHLPRLVVWVPTPGTDNPRARDRHQDQRPPGLAPAWRAAVQ